MPLIAHLTHKHYKWYWFQKWHPQRPIKILPSLNNKSVFLLLPSISCNQHSRTSCGYDSMIHLKTTRAQLIIVSVSRSQIMRFGSIRLLSRCESRVKRLVVPEAANPHSSRMEHSGLYPLLLFILLIQQPSAPQTPPQEITSDLGRACVCEERLTNSRTQVSSRAHRSPSVWILDVFVLVFM